MASLYHKGINKILEKSVKKPPKPLSLPKISTLPTILLYDTVADDTAVKDLVYEIADVWFHTMVTLAWFNIPSWAVTNELARRFGLSGIDEKAASNLLSNSH